MRDGKRPVFLTAEQIAALQDMILEKQYQLAAAQTESLHATDYAKLSEQMSHITDLLMALANALPESEELTTDTRSDLRESA
ncbi:MAG: hypothetical protein VX555_01190 [Pseudomonadota bacterium]|nr:hypothetical protein [Pseudomonadota bacterium]